MKECHTCLWWKPNQGEVEQAEYGLYECTHEALQKLKTNGTFGCNKHLGADATEVNVPDHVSKGTMTDPNPNPIDGPCEVLIVTYATPTMRVSGNVVSDFDWLEFCLRCMKKYLSGFQGITVAHPNSDIALFAPLVERFGVRLHGFDEVPGRGFLNHEIKIGEADLFLPPTTKYVLTWDADCMAKMPSTPEHWFANDKPYYITRTWKSLMDGDPWSPGSKAAQASMIWKAPTDAQLGFETEVFCMTMNTYVWPIDFFAKYRAHIEKVHGLPFSQYMLAGKNSFPQDRMDFTAMGAFAHRFMHDRWTWFDAMKPPFPADRKRQFWSHSGVDAEIRKQLEEMLK